MKLVGDLKDKVAKTQGMEEKRAAIAKAGMELNDNELEQVCGGTDPADAHNLVNEEREKAGLDSLDWDQNLENVSHIRAQEYSQSFSHTRTNGNAWYTVNSKIRGGENLAWGMDSSQDAVEDWMNSPAHRDNILYDEFENTAIGLFEDEK